MQIKCRINNQEKIFETSPTARVLDVLRESGFLSLKEGCGEGECGACSIFMDKKLVNACLLIAVQMEGCEIMTLEGLQEETQELRENYLQEGAVQCGFCTSGFVMRSLDYIQNGGEKNEKSLKEAFDGNLCRCSGYQKIVEATIKSMK